MRLRRAVILTNGKTYAENQCIGLLEALNLDVDVSVKVMVSVPVFAHWPQWSKPGRESPSAGYRASASQHSHQNGQ